jgi:Carboxypeptidase regulatory-like domain
MTKRLLLIFAFSAVCPAVFGQTDSGAIRVLVLDATGLAVHDAAVKLTNTATGVSASRVSDADGYASFSPVLRGHYTVDVSKSGFQQTRVKDLSVDVDERKLIRVALPVAAVNATVEVSASADIVQSEQGSIGQVIDGAAAVELPLAARRYTQLALLVPGATESTLDPTTRGAGWFVANGNYQTQNNFVIDGVDNNQGTTNAQSLSAQVVSPSPDAIAEFKVQTNSYSAEFGRSAGAVVNLVLKSGTNSLHGSAWYYNRDASLAATPWTSNLIGAGKPDLKWNQFGGTVGGPIRKNRLFYFVDYEGFLQDFSNPFLVTVPSAAEHAGSFYRTITDPGNSAPFPNNTIPQSRFDPLGSKLVALYPAANLPGQTASSGQTINNYGVQAPGNENTNKGDIKGDYNISGRDVVSLRWSYLRQDIYRNGILPGIADGVGNQGGQFNVNSSYGGTWTRSLTPAVVNSFRFGYTRTSANFTQSSVNGEGAAAFGFQIPAAAILAGNGGLPLINPSNYNQLGTRNFRPQFQKPELFQVLDSLSMVRGKHSLRTGFETRQKNDSFLDSARTVPEYDFNGRFTGESMADLLTGNVYQFSANTQEIVEQLQKAYAVYVQDDWKIAPNFTLNLGLRWEYETPYYGNSPYRNINFDFQTGQLIYASKPTDYLVTPDHRDFGPRVGAAWQIVPQKLVLRAGYGLFYSGEDMSGSDVNLPENPPQLIPVTLTQVSGGPPPLLLSQAVPTGIFNTYNTSIISLRAREKNYRAARIHQFNLAAQYLLPHESTLEVAYVGNRGYDEFAEYSLNQTPFGVDGSVAANRPYPQWAQITVGSQRSRSWYNALQVKFEKRLTGGWYTLASYTFASALDETGAWGANSSPQYLDNFAAEVGPQSQTARQRFTLSNVYELPFGRSRRFGANWSRLADAFLGGWQISNILTTRVGLPINVSLASSGVNPATNQNYSFLNRNGGGLRPNRVGDPNTGISPKDNRNAFLNPAAFQVQPLNTPGNSSRNVAVGPGLATMDLSLVKRFRVSERSAVDVRFEAFNAFNRVNFGSPNSTFGSSSFGIITSAGDPRIMQAALRFRF